MFRRGEGVPCSSPRSKSEIPVNNPLEKGRERWVKFPRPQIFFQYYDGFTGNLLYAESILAN